MTKQDHAAGSPPDPKHTLPTTYFVLDSASKEEQQRLFFQDQMLTVGMGGVLPEQEDPTRFERVLDVGCGTGGWLIALAKAMPAIAHLDGVDANKRLIEFARHCATEQGVQDRISFGVMDGLRMLEFPDSSFDLVNQRLGESFLRTWDWHKLLQEYRRVTRPGGVIRLTEADLHISSTSEALEQLFHLAVEAFGRAGHLFTDHSASVLERLPSLLAMYHVQPIRQRPLTLEYRAGTPEWSLFAEDMKQAFHTIVPFLRKWVRVPDDYEGLYQRAMEEITHPHFVARLDLLTVWGTRI